MRTAIAWLGLAALLIAVVLRPEVRGSVTTWLAAVWLLICWFWMARSKTVSWAFLSRWFTASVLWALVIGVGTLRWSAALGGDVGVDPGYPIVMAGIAEEFLKIVPLGAFAAAAARRFASFSVADYLVVGLASRSGFRGLRELRTGGRDVP